MDPRSHRSRTHPFHLARFRLVALGITLLWNCSTASLVLKCFCGYSPGPDDTRYAIISKDTARNVSSDCTDPPLPLLKATVETMCINDTSGEGCRELIHFSLSLGRKAQSRLKSSQLTLVESEKLEHHECRVSEKAPGFNKSKIVVFNFYLLMDYDCCDITMPTRSYLTLLTASGNAGSCETRGWVLFKPESRREDAVNRAVAVVTGDDSVTETSMPSPSEPWSFSAAQAGIVIVFLVISAAVGVLVVYISCRKCRNKYCNHKQIRVLDDNLNCTEDSNCIPGNAEQVWIPPDEVQSCTQCPNCAIERILIVPPSSSDYDTSKALTLSVAFIPPTSSDEEFSENDRFDSGYGPEFPNMSVNTN